MLASSVTTGAMHLPLEILVHILEPLQLSDLLNCRVACKSLKAAAEFLIPRKCLKRDEFKQRLTDGQDSNIGRSLFSFEMHRIKCNGETYHDPSLFDLKNTTYIPMSKTIWCYSLNAVTSIDLSNIHMHTLVIPHFPVKRIYLPKTLHELTINSDSECCIIGDVCNVRKLSVYHYTDNIADMWNSMKKLRSLVIHRVPPYTNIKFTNNSIRHLEIKQGYNNSIVDLRLLKLNTLMLDCYEVILGDCTKLIRCDIDVEHINTRPLFSSPSLRELKLVTPLLLVKLNLPRATRIHLESSNGWRKSLHIHDSHLPELEELSIDGSTLRLVGNMPSLKKLHITGSNLDRLDIQVRNLAVLKLHVLYVHQFRLQAESLKTAILGIPTCLQHQLMHMFGARSRHQNNTAVPRRIVIEEVENRVVVIPNGIEECVILSGKSYSVIASPTLKKLTALGGCQIIKLHRCKNLKNIRTSNPDVRLLRE